MTNGDRNFQRIHIIPTSWHKAGDLRQGKSSINGGFSMRVDGYHLPYMNGKENVVMRLSLLSHLLVHRFIQTTRFSAGS